MTVKEKLLGLVAEQIKVIDKHEIELQSENMRFETQKIRLELFDIITKKGYTLTSDYVLIKNKTI